MYADFYSRESAHNTWNPFHPESTNAYYELVDDDVIAIITTQGCGCCSTTEVIKYENEIEGYIEELENELDLLKSTLKNFRKNKSN
jgi:hypothetical protein